MVAAALGGAYATDAIGIHPVFGAFAVGVAMPRAQSGERVAELRRGSGRAIGAARRRSTSSARGWRSTSPACAQATSRRSCSSWRVACAGKFLGAFAGARAARMRPRDAAAIAVLMNTRGVVEIVLLTVGRDRGLIDDRLFTLFALMAIFTTLLDDAAAARDRPALARTTRRTPCSGVVTQDMLAQRSPRARSATAGPRDMDPEVSAQANPTAPDTRVDRLAADLANAVEQQKATSQVLEAIGRSDFELAPVFETVVRHAVHLSGADGGMVWQLEDGVYRMVLGLGGSDEYRSYLDAHPIAAGSSTVVGRVGLERRTVQFADAREDPEYGWQEALDLGGFRTDARRPDAGRRPASSV